jgi:acetyl-CoA C-acetyltransferase
MDMRAYLESTGTTEEDCSRVVVKNKGNAMSNPLAVRAGQMTPEQVKDSGYVFEPMRKSDMSELADGSVVMVLANAEIAKKKDKSVWVEGLGWASESPWLEGRDWGAANYARMASEMAFKNAKTSSSNIQLFEMDDKFSYKELQHLEAIGVCGKGEAKELLRSGQLERDGKVPTNVSGGSLGVGNILDASGLHSAYEAVLQLRKDAGKMQVEAEKALVQSWRGVPTATGAVAILGV